MIRKIIYLITKNWKWILCLLATVAICYWMAHYLGKYSDYAYFITVVLCILIVLSIYRIFFKGNKGFTFFIIICELLDIIFVNHWYSHRTLLQQFPYVSYVDQKVIVFGFIVGGLAIFSIIKIVILVKNVINSQDLGNPDDRAAPDEEVLQGKEIDRFKPEKESDRKSERSFEENDSVGDMQEEERQQNRVRKNSVAWITNIVLVVLILGLVLVFSCIIYFKMPESLFDNDFADPFNIIMGILGNEAVILFILGIVFVTLSIAIVMVKYLRANIMKLLDSWTGKESDQLEPSYMVSVFIVLALLYFSFKIGDFSIDDFANMVVEGKYLAFPLAVLIVATIFYILMWVVHTMLILLYGLKLENIKSILDKGLKRTELKEKAISLIEILIEIVYNSIDFVLRFLNFFPDFISTMEDFLGFKKKNMGNGKDAQETKGVKGNGEKD